jgi:hypothetical protein
MTSTLGAPVCVDGGYLILVAYPEDINDVKSSIAFEEFPVLYWQPFDRGCGVIESVPMLVDDDLGFAVGLEDFIFFRFGVGAASIVSRESLGLLSSEDTKNFESRVRSVQTAYLKKLAKIDAAKILKAKEQAADSARLKAALIASGAVVVRSQLKRQERS